MSAVRRKAEALVQSLGGFVQSLDRVHLGRSQRVELVLRLGFIMGCISLFKQQAAPRAH